MNIQCASCGTQHELDPPSWVVSSGRPFLFRCSSCGHPQRVSPTPDTPSPVGSLPTAAKTDSGKAPENSAKASSSEPAAPSVPRPMPEKPDNTDAPAVARPDDSFVSDSAPTAAPESVPVSSAPMSSPETELAQHPMANPRKQKESQPTKNIAGIENAITTPPPVVSRVPSKSFADADTPIRASRDHSPNGASEREESNVEPVFLKQNGQIYTVQGWEVLKQWIREKRVDRHDMVSEGGVRWEFIDSRPDLMELFADPTPNLASLPPTPEPTPFPFADGLFGGGGGWHDDDTEGIPTGLPPLPTEEQAHEEGLGIELLPVSSASEKRIIHEPMPLALMDTPLPGGKADSNISQVADLGNSSTLDGPEHSDAEVTWPVTNSPLSTPAPAPVSAPPPSIVGAAVTEDDEVIEYVDDDRTVELPIKEPEADLGGPIDQWDALIIGSNPDVVDTAPSAPTREPLLAANRPVAPTFIDDIDEPVEGGNQKALYAVVGVLALSIILGAIYCGSSGLFSKDTVARGPQPTISVPKPRALPEPTAPVPAVAPDPDNGQEAATEPPVPEPTVAPEPVEPAQPEPAQPESVKPEPVKPEPVKPEPAKPDPVKPEPAKPEPVKPSANVGKLVSEAWNVADRDPNKALSLFNQAVGQQPGNGLAWYGKGYVLLRKGDKGSAKTALCKARNRLKGGDRSEVEGLLSSNDLSCP